MVTDYTELISRLRSTKSRSKRKLLDEAAATIEAMAKDMKITGDCETCRYYSADGFRCGFGCGECKYKCRCYLCVGSSLFEWRGVQE